MKDTGFKIKDTGGRMQGDRIIRFESSIVISLYPILICLLFFLLIGNTLNAQYSNNWCFGDSAGINFNNIPPTTFTSAVKSRGSCASISDSLGNLLFYTSYDPTPILTGQNPSKNGNVYDVFGNIMQNGDSIVMEAWYQEALIISPTFDSNIFYIFSVGVGLQEGLFYSIVDISQNGGLGAVTQKNIQLLNLKSVDCISAIKHGNGRDWWVFFKTYGSVANNIFYKFLITPSGISGPFIQSIGTPSTASIIHMCINKEGNQMAILNYVGMIELVDFDRCSGQFSNYKLIKPNVTTPPVPGVWSGAFSPDGTKLYVATSYDDSYLWQFNLLDSLPQNTVDTLANFNFSIPAGGALKLAPDNKIYWSCAWNDGVTFNYPYPDTTYNMYNMNLSVINSPDSLGAACNFQPYSFYLGGKRTYWGLPNNPNYELGPLTGSLCDTLTVGLNEIANYKNNITVYYDALWQIAFVNAKGLKGKNYTLQLFNLNGQLILQEQGKLNSEYFTKDLNLLANSNGLYIVRLITEKEVLTTKFVKE